MEEGSLILVKHAMPELNDNLPAKEWVLGEKGKKQAEKFSKFIAENLDFDTVIYSSPEPKAMATAQILSEKLNASIELEKNLKELDRPVLNIVSEEVHNDRNEAIFENPGEAVIGDESANEALARFEKGIKEVMTKPLVDSMKDERIVVTHGTVMSLFLSKYNSELQAFDVWKTLSCPSYAIVSIPDFKILELNGKPLTGI
jgi:broad specificity phosphatase PhoE